MASTSSRWATFVTLELTFANHGDGAYTFDPVGYDRSGRLGLDRVHVSPQELTSDPMRDYYRGMLFGFVGGGLSAIPTLLREPRPIELRVNEWVRFETPGEYRLFVESGRLENDALDRHDPARRVRLVSNMLSIRIVARDEPADEPDLADWPVERLRFADTAAAAREMVRRLIHSVEIETRVGTDLVALRHGLLATPHRRVALDAVESALDMHTGLVNPHVVEIAAFLAVMNEQPRQVVDPDTALEDGSVVKRRFDTYRCRVTTYRGRALAAGVRGSPEEQARALVTFGRGEAPDDCEQSTGLMSAASPGRADMRRILPDVFHHLTHVQQHQMLAREWGLIASAAMAPVLRRLVSEGAAVPDDVRDVALVRLGEVDPRAAREVAMRDIINGTNRFSVAALQIGALPAEDVEKIASVLGTRLRKEGPDVSRASTFRSLGGRGALLLVERFGALPILDDIRAVLGPTALLMCAAQTAWVAYVLRVAPPTGSDLLQEQLAGKAPCREQLLDTLARTWPHLVPEEVAIATLEHANPRVASSAAGALALMGNEAGRRALWRRLERWHGHWKDRVADDMEAGLDRRLREALLRAVRRRPTIDERFKIRELCLTDSCRAEFSPFRRAPDPTTLVVTADESSGDTVFHVDGVWARSAEAVAQRLSLYPEGTRAEWRPGVAHSAERARALHVQLEAAAAVHGLTVSARPTHTGQAGSANVP